MFGAILERDQYRPRIAAAHGGVMRRCNYDTQLLPLAAEREAA
jgi:hypothetical protein